MNKYKTISKIDSSKDFTIECTEIKKENGYYIFYLYGQYLFSCSEEFYHPPVLVVLSELKIPKYMGDDRQ